MSGDRAPDGTFDEGNAAGADTAFKPGNPHAFPKGKSGNPGGRRKITPDMKRRLGKLCKEGLDFCEEVMRGGNDDLKFKVTTWVWDRHYGKPVQQTEISGPDEGAINIRHVPTEDLLRALAVTGDGSAGEDPGGTDAQAGG